MNGPHYPCRFGIPCSSFSLVCFKLPIHRHVSFHCVWNVQLVKSETQWSQISGHSLSSNRAWESIHFVDRNVLVFLGGSLKLMWFMWLISGTWLMWLIMWLLGSITVSTCAQVFLVPSSSHSCQHWWHLVHTCRVLQNVKVRKNQKNMNRRNKRCHSRRFSKCICLWTVLYSIEVLLCSFRLDRHVAPIDWHVGATRTVTAWWVTSPLLMSSNAAGSGCHIIPPPCSAWRLAIEGLDGRSDFSN